MASSATLLRNPLLQAAWATTRRPFDARLGRPRSRERPGSVEGDGPTIFRPSHRDLLRRLDAERWQLTGRAPGAVVVPTARTATDPRSGIRLAARLAVAVERPLVLLVSKAAATRASLEALGPQLALDGPAPEILVVHLAATPGEWTSFDVDDLEISRAYRRGGHHRHARIPANDTGRKRNLAVLLARSMGWSSVLLLDDDILVPGRTESVQPTPATLDVTSLLAAVSAVESHEHGAVGFAIRDFDDNSVLCRMRGALVEPQEQFIGGGALVCGVTDHTPFFPAIYNEDWLFLLGLLRQRWKGAPWAEAGVLRQDPYDAYAPTRAASEEFGDILGEGLMSLLTPGQAALPNTDATYWQAAIDGRIGLRRKLELAAEAYAEPEREDMLLALKTIRVIHERLTAEKAFWLEQFAAYPGVWQRDLDRWRSRLTGVVEPAELLRSREVTPGGVRVVGGELASFVERFQSATVGPSSRLG